MIYSKVSKLTLKGKIDVIKNKIGFYFLIFLIFIFTSSLIQSIKRANSIKLEVERKNESLENLKKEQERLKKELLRVQSEEYIERQLRDNLGLSKEGEITVVLPDPDIVKKFAPNLETPEEALPDPNWKRWMKLFIPDLR